VTDAKGRVRHADARELAFLRKVAANQPMLDRIDAWFLAYENAHPRTLVAVRAATPNGAAGGLAPSAPLFTDAPERDAGDVCAIAGLELYNATQNYYAFGCMIG
jgi:glycerate kinase